MKGFCEDCAKYETCEKAIGFEFGYCTTDFAPKKQKASEITTKTAKEELTAISDLITEANTRLLELGTTAARSINSHKYNETFVQLHTTFLKALKETKELKELFL